MSEEVESKKRGKYNTKRKQEIEKLLAAAKEFEFKEKRESTKFKYTIEEMTKNVCLYPDRYLNNDNSCITCNLYEHCACTMKNLGKKGKK